MKSAIAITAASAALATAAATPAKLETRASGTSSGGVPQVSVKGNAFWAGENRFYVRGVDYQPGGSSDAKDPIADVDGCKRDVEEFKKLGINTVRVYTVDNTADHDECMSMLADAGIYLALDVNTPKYSLNRGDPGPSYNKVYLQSLFATVDAFANYDNTLLFFSGNEVINDDKTTPAAPYVKAVTRDLRQYIGSRGYRKIPVGYSAADVESNRFEMAQYMNCGTDDQRSDFYAFNDYSWCDPSSFTQAGWDQKVKQYGDYSIPLFLSEYGCNKNKRTFEAVKSLYDSDMSSVYSGGLVYEYSEEDSNYGLVKIDGDSVTENEDFKELMQQFKDNPSPEGDGGYKSDGKASPCPANSDSWDVTAFKDDELPAIPDGADKFMKDGAGKGPGLKGDGSQNAGGGSTATAQPGSGSVTAVASNAASNSGGSNSDAADAAESSAGASSLIMGEMGKAPLICGAVVLISTLFGASLI